MVCKKKHKPKSWIPGLVTFEKGILIIVGDIVRTMVGPYDIPFQYKSLGKPLDIRSNKNRIRQDTPGCDHRRSTHVHNTFCSIIKKNSPEFSRHTPSKPQFIDYGFSSIFFLCFFFLSIIVCAIFCFCSSPLQIWINVTKLAFHDCLFLGTASNVCSYFYYLR